MTAIQGNPEVWLIFQDLLDSARSLTSCQDPRRTFGQGSRTVFKVRKMINVPPKVPAIPPAGYAIENVDWIAIGKIVRILFFFSTAVYKL